jgi:hypothetical protein
MVNISTVTAIWSGFTGSPGYTLFRFAELDTGAKLNAAGAAMRTFLSTIATSMASGAGAWTIQVQGLVQHHEIGTGDLVGESTMGTVPSVITGSGTAGSAYAGGSGAVVHWTTGATHGGRKIRGRTFLVPLLLTAFSADGTITTTLINSLTTAGGVLIADANADFGVYSRYWDKKPGDPPLDVPPKQVGGSFTTATGIFVPDRAAQLRTRRS